MNICTSFSSCCIKDGNSNPSTSRKDDSKFQFFIDRDVGILGDMHLTTLYFDSNPLDINRMTKKGGNTALHFASMNTRINIVKYLVDTAGADINIRSTTDGKTALHWATIRDNMELVKYLYSRGANVNATDNQGYTALHYAGIYGRIEIVKLLYSLGEDVGKDIDKDVDKDKDKDKDIG
jgi:ankyrin repeat protein